MNPYNKAARSVIRLLAFGLIVTSLMLLGAHLFENQVRREPSASPRTDAAQTHVSKWRITVEAVPLALGLLLFFQSGPLARVLTARFEE